MTLEFKLSVGTSENLTVTASATGATTTFESFNSISSVDSTAIAKKIGPKTDDAAKPRATFMTMNTEVLKIATTVAPEDVAVPAGFKESK